MSINIWSFVWTGTFGLIAIAFLYLATGGVFGRAARILLSVIISLAITPTVWAPLRGYYIESASLAAGLGILGVVEWHYGLLFGFLPIGAVFGVVMFVFGRRKVRGE